MFLGTLVLGILSLLGRKVQHGNFPDRATETSRLLLTGDFDIMLGNNDSLGGTL